MESVHHHADHDHIMSALALLYGTDTPPPAGLDHLEREALKQRYRQLLLKNHPDRHRVIGEPPEQLAARTRLIIDAYRVLSAYLACPGAPGTSPLRKRHDTDGRPSDAFHRYQYRGVVYWVPRKNMNLGRFLAALQVINYRTFLQAQVWIAARRPLLGDLARSMDLITKGDIAEILSRRRRGERFGACALRLGFMRHEDLAWVVGRQRELAPGIGEYLVARGHVGAEEMEYLAGEFARLFPGGE